VQPLSHGLCKLGQGHTSSLAESQTFEHSSKKDKKNGDSVCGEYLTEFIVWHDEYKNLEGMNVSTGGGKKAKITNKVTSW